MTRKRKKHTPLEKEVENHFEEVERYFGADGTKLVRDHRVHREGKISDRIAFLVDPLLRDLDASTSDFASSIVAIACTAWNASLVNIFKRQKMVDDFLNALAPFANAMENRVVVQNLIEDFTQRKLEHFPGDKRFITSYKVVPNSSGFQLSVVSIDMENQQT